MVPEFKPKVLTQSLFLNFSELQVRVDGVNATRCHRDAVDVAVRESTRLVSRRRRSAQGPPRAPSSSRHYSLLGPGSTSCGRSAAAVDQVEVAV